MADDRRRRVPVEAALDEHRDGGFVEARPGGRGYSSVDVGMTEPRNEMARRLTAAVPDLAAKVAGHEDELDAALRARWDEARAAWPALTVSADAWLAAIGAGLADATTPVARIGELHAADLYLACACEDHNQEAIL